MSKENTIDGTTEEMLLCPLCFNAVISAGVTTPTATEFSCKRDACALFDKARKMCGLLSQAESLRGLAVNLDTLVNVLQRELQNISAELRAISGTMIHK